MLRRPRLNSQLTTCDFFADDLEEVDAQEDSSRSIASFHALKLELESQKINVIKQPSPKTLLLPQHRVSSASTRANGTNFSLRKTSGTVAMWLLEAKAQRLVHLMDDRVVLGKYAVLSHTWQDEEVTFQDMQNAPARAHLKKGYEKINKVCQQAIADNLLFAWVDTCCINKESSAELSEAINSMFRWYSNLAVCYAYLTDVDTGGANLSSTAAKATQFRALLKDSRWLTRGWTLQELIAPEKTVFYDQNWHAIGDSTVSNLQVAIADLTGIDTALLRDRRLLQGLPIAKRLSWAAERRTTREEDQAYSLLGILELNMPLLYGEGPRALLRLQEDVLNTTTDQSILHWTPTHPSHVGLLMAPEVHCFKHCGELLHRPDVFEDESHEVVSNGLRIRLPMRNMPNESGVYVAALN